MSRAFRPSTALLALVTACSTHEEGPSVATPEAGVVACNPTSDWKARTDRPLFGYDPKRADGIPGDPSVVRTDEQYVMYYGAVHDLGTKVVSIFRGTSQDGLAWERTGTPVLSPGVAGSWDGFKVETPNVLRRPDGSWAMYYSGNGGSDPNELGFAIGLATSADGVTWTRVGSGPVLGTTATEQSLIGPSVLYESETSSYLMMYAAIDGLGKISIFLATSANGEDWERRGNVVTMSNVERRSPEDFGVMGPELLKTDRGYELVYNSLLAPKGASGGIYYASSTDALTWKKHPTPIHLPTGGTTAFDATEVGAQAWLRENDAYRIWYVGTNTDYESRYDLGIALLEHACK